MDNSKRLSEVDAAIASIKARYLAKARAPAPDVDRTAWHRECGEQMARDLEVGSLYNERAALQAQIAGICSFDGNMFLATQAGLFQIVGGNRLRFIKLEAGEPCPVPTTGAT